MHVMMCEAEMASSGVATGSLPQAIDEVRYAGYASAGGDTCGTDACELRFCRQRFWEHPYICRVYLGIVPRAELRAQLAALHTLQVAPSLSAVLG